MNNRKPLNFIHNLIISKFIWILGYCPCLYIAYACILHSNVTIVIMMRDILRSRIVVRPALYAKILTTACRTYYIYTCTVLAREIWACTVHKEGRQLKQKTIPFHVSSFCSPNSQNSILSQHVIRYRINALHRRNDISFNTIHMHGRCMEYSQNFNHS